MITIFIKLILFLNLNAKNFTTNELDVIDAPNWVKKTKVEKVTDRIQNRLEWTIKKTPVRWYSHKDEFAKAHTLGPAADAVIVKSNSQATIHMGPTINENNYQQILGHELVHLIFFQKYKGAIPQWLEEGFANNLSGQGKVDYKWLSQQSLPTDIDKMGHPYSGSEDQIMMQYKLSQALVEMLAKKCNLQQLLQLSVERKMADYIKSYCGITDINEAIKKWIEQKTKSS